MVALSGRRVLGKVSNYNEVLGRRLRAIRRQRGLSLQEVQRVTAGEFKAAVLGAYERGERSISVPRLHRLAQVYGVPAAQLLPPDGDGDLETGGLTIDLNRIERLSDDDAAMFERFLKAIQLMRQDYNGRVLTIRRDDLRLLATLLERSEEELGDELRGRQVIDPGR